ncbi:hypothetical protein CHH28_16460 [Bacterioplanes sanyensis]|uniref:peptidylprolyl isomerase n=1 Tax=Bacterioplanes sanyensis TaxID=1249553 RepID=A0A222FN06_9GAMM|nr:peptidylprolyl isomerase [Bacterioplanes sanyensis]ASP40170.1 hypothetical protein CHH28_16460 [Bacterioplanes sanyensis]
MKKLLPALSVMLLTACGDADYVAKVDGTTIDKAQFVHYLESKGVPTDSLQGKDELLKDYATSIALEQQIEQQGELDVEKINASVANYRRNQIINEYFQRVIDSKVTEDAVENYFHNNSEKFEDVRVQVAHILKRTNRGMTEDEIEQARAAIYAVYNKLETGEPFELLAQTASDDSISGKRGGDLGWLKKGAISPSFSKIAFELDEGSYSAPIETEYGFHIVKVITAPKVVKKSLKDVRGEIRHTLKANAKRVELDRLLSNADIDINQDGLQ